MKQIRILLASLLFATITSGHSQGLVINELMQSNIDCTMDDLNEFPDSWVELYNAGDSAVNLNDYLIGTDTDAGHAWQLPSKTVAAKGYALIYCDKVGKRFHTDFHLESGKGCQVYLFKGGELADRLPAALPKMPAPNIAYGRQTDGSDQWGYQLTPTPNAPNSGETCNNDHILGSPVFSEQGRAVAGKLNLKLELSLPEGCPEGTEIRYTANGQEPTEKSNLYMSPISISKSTVILAKLFCKGWLSPRSTAQSYISHGRAITMPVISIAMADKYLNDSKIGIYPNNNGNNKKNDWRRPVNIEFFFDSDAASSINQLCETRVAGGATRGAALKTLAVYANKRFGTKRLDYEFFPDQKPGLTDFKSLMLRNAGNDFDYLYMRDGVIQRNAASHLDLDWQAYRPAIVYINGTYRGMLNIRERSNDDNIYTNYDGLEDIDMFENWEELKAGTWDNYNQFKEFYADHGHTLAEYEKWMDTDEFMNLMIVNLYHVNLDFPGNNIVMWRPRAEGGRWRWVMKDTDFGLGLYGRPVSYKVFDWLYNPDFDSNNRWGANSYEATRLFRRLMEDEDFFTKFVDRCMIYTGDFLNEKGIREVWDPMYEAIKGEYQYHRNLFNPWWPNYSQELNSARTWVRQRTNTFITQLSTYYKLGTPAQVSINPEAEGATETGITFNGFRLSKSTFDGRFFTGHTISLDSDDEEQPVAGWRVTEIQTNGSITIREVSGSQLTMEMPACSKLVITALTGTPDGIGTITTTAGLRSGNVYDLNGRIVRQGSTSLDGLPRGIYIVNGRKIIIIN